MNQGPHNQNSAASEGHIQALRDAFGSDLEVESLAAEAPPAAAVHEPPPSPPAARSGAPVGRAAARPALRPAAAVERQRGKRGIANALGARRQCGNVR